MKLTSQDLQQLSDLAITAAQRAGEYIQSQVGKPRQVQTKNAGTSLASQVVTQVDLESQRLILQILRESLATYQLGLLTEESPDDTSRREKSYFWCIDPLDGTLPFIEGQAGFSVSIALVSRSGQAELGVVHDPLSGDVFHSLRGQQAFKNGTPLPPPSEPAGGVLTWLMDRSMQTLPIYPVVVKAMQEVVSKLGCVGLKIVDSAGAALNAAWVTQHPAAVYFKFPKSAPGGGSLWDFAATACLMEAWGQPATDMVGNPLDLNRPETTFMHQHGVLYASHAKLSIEILSLAKQLNLSSPPRR